MRGKVLFILLLAGTLVGCESQMVQRMDRELAMLIQQRQKEALGDEGVGTQPVPAGGADTHAGPAAYDPKPPTYNPAAAELPSLKPADTQPADTQPAAGMSSGMTIVSPLAATTQPELQPAATQPSFLDPEEADPMAIPLDIESALAYGIGHSRDYRNRKEDLYLTALNLLTEQHLWGPQFFSTLTAQAVGIPEAGDQDQALQLLSSTGVSQRLPYGGSISASALVSYINYLHHAADSTNLNNQSTSLLLSGSIPLLRGAGPYARKDLIQKERNLFYAVRTFEQYRRQFLVDVASRFYDLIQSYSSIRNRRTQLANFEWLAKRTEAMARAGRVPFIEVQRAEQQVLFARNDLLDAREQYALQRDSFKILIGLSVETRFRLVISAIEMDTPTPDQNAAVGAAMHLRLDLQNTADQVEDAKRQVAEARNQLLPDAQLFGTMTLPTDPAVPWGGARLNAASGTYTAGVSLDIPLDRRAEELDLRRSLIGLERAERSYSLQKDQVAQDVRRAVRQIQQAARSLEMQNRNIELAQKRKRGVVLRLRELGPRDFIEAQSDFLSAQDRADKATRDLRVSILQYLRDSGQMRVSTDGRFLAPGKATELPGMESNPQSDIPRLLKEAENLGALHTKSPATDIIQNSMLAPHS